MQLVEILSHSNKIKTIDDLLNHFDLVVELAKNDIYWYGNDKIQDGARFEIATFVR
jgi:hypothetical protein